MNPKHSFFKILSSFLLLSLALGTVGGISAGAAQNIPEAVKSAGLSTSDWAQIKALRAAFIPYQQAYLKASNTETNDTFGSSVAISGNTMVVGAPFEASNAKGVNGDQNNNLAMAAGAAYVFIRSGTTWSQQAYLKASNTEAGDQFGSSVAISGDTVVVGALDEDSKTTGVNGIQNNNMAARSGAVYVFTRSGTTWSQQAYVKASNTDAYDNFGGSVAVSRDTLVVGAWNEDSNATGVNGVQSDDSADTSGAAYVFIRSGTIWSQQAYLKASNTEANDQFGASVAVSLNTVVVGARNEDSNATGMDGDQNDNTATDSGAAYVFTRNGTAWSQQAYLKASNTEADDFFGSQVAVSGDSLVVGAYGEDSNATGVNGNQVDNSKIYSGAAYIFARSDTTWNQQAYLKASNTDAFDSFGFSIAISGDMVLVGASGESSSATGVNGDQNNNLSFCSGAAYIFARSGTTWSQQAYLKASNNGAEDYFGISAAIDGNTAVIGAYNEDSNATGVNGDQTNNSAEEAGAAYTYAQKYTTTLQSMGAYDGHVLESGENSNVGGLRDATSTIFKLGDEAGDKQYRAILHFNTSGLPDNAIIIKVTLKIKKQGLVGTNPFTILGRLKADIRKPYFGAFPGLQVTDFQAAANKVLVGTFTINPVNNWYIGVIGSAGYPYINKTGATQFRLRFYKDDNDDMNADYMKFYSGNYLYAASRPTLVIEYYVP